MAGLPVHHLGAPTGPEDNNPQKFHLWTTGSNFSYTFTCDPHASDIWMFRTAGGNLLVSPRGPDALQVSTNLGTNEPFCNEFPKSLPSTSDSLKVLEFEVLTGR
ncbi:MAG TPA: hypothetical protein VMB80_03710 [Candidatus Acidoferrum sp.]|nr:hypothetical protein [Candidatus Acidoferrum sp.]